MNGSGTGIARAVERHLPLLHDFEQRRLRLGGRAVDLVGEQEVREDRPCARDELALGVEQRMADDVGRHEIGRELDAREGAVERARQRAHQQRLAEAGHAFEQHVPAGEQRGQRLLDDVVLAHDRLVDLVAKRADDPARGFELLVGERHQWVRFVELVGEVVKRRHRGGVLVIAGGRSGEGRRKVAFAHAERTR